jgi:hypothetical protein
MNEMSFSKTLTTTTSTGMKTIQVHHSRIIHFAENSLENDIIGTSALLCVFNLLDDLLKVVGGSAETFFITSNRGMQVDVDKEMELTGDDADALEKEVEEYTHQLRRIIRTRGVKINNLGTDIADPRGAFSTIMQLISGATGIPQRVLLGSEAGHLASDQDRANWADRIRERRNTWAEPRLLRQLIKTLVSSGVLPEPQETPSLNGVSKPTIVWPEAYQMSPLEKSNERQRLAQTVNQLSQQKRNGWILTTQEEARKIIGLPETMSGTIPEIVALPTQGKPTDISNPGDNPPPGDGNSGNDKIQSTPATPTN